MMAWRTGHPPASSAVVRPAHRRPSSSEASPLVIGAHPQTAPDPAQRAVTLAANGRR